MNMRIARHARPRGLVLAMLCALAALALTPRGAVAQQHYEIQFDTTANILLAVNGATPAVADKPTGSMSVIVQNGQSEVHFKVRGARPNTIYTIWTVFKKLWWPLCYDSQTQYLNGVPVCVNTAGPGFPEADKPQEFTVKTSPLYEAGVVAPLARFDSAFTDGMRLDPGAVFMTNGNGDGDVNLTLDYNLMGGESDGPPVGNSHVITQCVPNCQDQELNMRVTSTWLRKYIRQVQQETGLSGSQLASVCANYDGTTNSLYWECIDPATANPRTGNGLPRVFRFAFDHFRLAAHPDDLTHGFIGGTDNEHVIDMVGRACTAYKNCTIYP